MRLSLPLSLYLYPWPLFIIVVSPALDINSFIVGLSLSLLEAFIFIVGVYLLLTISFITGVCLHRRRLLVF